MTIGHCRRRSNIGCRAHRRWARTVLHQWYEMTQTKAFTNATRWRRIKLAISDKNKTMIKLRIAQFTKSTWSRFRSSAVGSTCSMSCRSIARFFSIFIRARDVSHGMLHKRFSSTEVSYTICWSCQRCANNTCGGGWAKSCNGSACCCWMSNIHAWVSDFLDRHCWLSSEQRARAES